MVMFQNPAFLNTLLGPELGQRRLIIKGVEPHLYRHPDVKLVRGQARNPGRQTRTFIEFDDCGNVRNVVGEGGIERLINDGPAMDLALARRRRPFPP